MPYKNEISGVYCLKSIDCKIIYIGSSTNIKRRFALHKSSIKRKDFSRGVSPFFDCKDLRLEILEETSNLLEREQYWIDFYKNQDIWKLINVFDADRKGSNIQDSFRKKMSSVLKDRWKNPEYRELALSKSKKTRFTSERSNKKVHIYKNGVYEGYLPSSKKASEILKIPEICLASCARGKYRNKHKYREYIFVYDQIRVLYKLEELLEAHQELRVISSRAWEANFEYQEGSTTNYWAIASNNIDTSIQHYFVMMI